MNNLHQVQEIQNKIPMSFRLCHNMNSTARLKSKVKLLKTKKESLNKESQLDSDSQSKLRSIAVKSASPFKYSGISNNSISTRMTSDPVSPATNFGKTKIYSIKECPLLKVNSAKCIEIEKSDRLIHYFNEKNIIKRKYQKIAIDIKAEEVSEYKLAILKIHNSGLIEKLNEIKENYEETRKLLKKQYLVEREELLNSYCVKNTIIKKPLGDM